MTNKKMKKESPSMDQWLKEAKAHESASGIGMYLFHNGVVRETPKAQVRQGIDDGSIVTGMVFDYEAEKIEEAIKATYKMSGITYIKVWLNQGTLEVGDDIMFVLIGGDIRPNVIDALQSLVSTIKTYCVTEIEHLTSIE